MIDALNSKGLPYAIGDVWLCAACGASGPDRDDAGVTKCPKNDTRPGAGAHLPKYRTGGVFWTPGWVRHALAARALAARGTR